MKSMFLAKAALLSATLAWSCALAAPLVKADDLNIAFYQDNAALVFAKNGRFVSYVHGQGWSDDLQADAPKFGYIPLEVVKALNWSELPLAVARTSLNDDGLTVVLEGVAGALPDQALAVDQSTTLELPYWVAPQQADTAVGFSHSDQGTTLEVVAKPNTRVWRHVYSLQQPNRLVVEYYFLKPEINATLAEGIDYQEQWLFIPKPGSEPSLQPVRTYTTKAAAGRFKLSVVGTLGQRKTPAQMAPQALAVLNGGYFDMSTGIPIGLWLNQGTPLSNAFGRGVLYWNQQGLFTTIPKYGMYAVGAMGTKVKVALNLNPSRYTVYNALVKVGKPTENLLVVEGNIVVANVPAPVELKAGQWALAYPNTETPLSKTGETLTLERVTEPYFENGLEAGPILLQDGRNVFGTTNEVFKDKAPLQKRTQQSLVAWTQNGDMSLITTDPATPEQLAAALLEGGYWGAIRMDAGGSAQLWVRGKLVNRSDTSPRLVANGLALFALEPQ